jgi:hypothetical protein
MPDEILADTADGEIPQIVWTAAALLISHHRIGAE